MGRSAGEKQGAGGEIGVFWGKRRVVCDELWPKQKLPEVDFSKKILHAIVHAKGRLFFGGMFGGFVHEASEESGYGERDAAGEDREKLVSTA